MWRRTRRVGEGNHAVGVADVERIAHQRHAERLVQSLQKQLLGFGHAVADSASRSSVMRFALTPMASARFIVLTMA